VTATITLYPEPLKATSRQIFKAEDGTAVIDWLQQNYPNGFGAPIAMSLDGEFLAIEDADRQLESDSHLIIAIVPGTPAIGAILLQSLLIALASAAITLLVTAIFGTKPKALQGQPAADPVYSLSGAQNAPATGDPIPVIYGRVITTPSFASQPYAFFENNEQYLCEILCIGQGEYDLLNVLIGETEASSLFGDSVVYWQIPQSVHLNSMGNIEALTGVFEDVVTSPEVGNQELLQPVFNPDYPPLDPNEPIPRGGVQYATSVTHNTTIAADPNTGKFTLGSWPPITPGVGTFFQIAGGTANDGFWEAYETNIASRTISVNEYSVPMVAQAATAGQIILFNDGASTNVSSGPFAACAPGKRVTQISSDIVFPQGIFGVDRKTGLFISETAQIEMIAQEIDDDGNVIGSPQLSITTAFTAATNTPRRYTLVLDVPVGRYQVSMVRLTAVPQTSDRVSNAVWTALKAKLERVTTPIYGDTTLLVIKMRATNGISSEATSRVRATVVRRLPNFLGDGAMRSTVSVIDAFIDAFTNQAYGGRLPQTQLDMLEIRRVAAHFADRAEFNGAFTQRSTLWEAAQIILQGAGASPIPYGGLVSIAIDGKKAVRSQLFADSNILAGSATLTYEFGTPSDFDGVRIEYRDPQTFNPAFVEWPLDAIDPEQIQLPGCTNKAVALQFARLRWQRLVIQRKSLGFATELEGLLPRVGDRVAASLHMPKWSVSGNVVQVNGTSIFVDEDLDWSGPTHAVIIRSETGVPHGPVVVTRGVSDNNFVLATLPPFPIRPEGAQEGAIYAFGQDNVIVRDFSLVGIEPQGNNQVRLSMNVYDEAIFAGAMPWLEEAF
jgi:hypothetical protein